jgi:hypothetical protein
LEKIQVAVKSGSDFDEHYNGSTGSNGETRNSESKESNWQGWSKGDTVSVNHAQDGHGSMLAKGSSSNNSKSESHLHYFDNPAPGDKHHKEGYQTGERLVSTKKPNIFLRNLEMLFVILWAGNSKRQK